MAQPDRERAVRPGGELQMSRVNIDCGGEAMVTGRGAHCLFAGGVTMGRSSTRAASGNRWWSQQLLCLVLGVVSLAFTAGCAYHRFGACGADGSDTCEETPTPP